MARSRTYYKSRSRPRSRPDSRSRSRSRSDRSRTCCAKSGVCGLKSRAFLLTILPIVIGVILSIAGAGNGTLAVFTFTNSGVSYHIGASGYTTSGNDAVSGQTLNYKAPSSWPSPVDTVPLLLLLHLILGLVYALYLICLIVRCSITKNNWDLEITSRWSRSLAFLLGLLVIGLIITDAVWWGGAQGQEEDLRPDVLGYFVIIGCSLLAVAWLSTVCVSILELRPAKRVWTDKHGREVSYHEDEIAVYDPSKRKTTYWDWLVGNNN